VNLWVLARPKDRGLEGLERIPEDVLVTRGQVPADFAEKPRPDAILVCSVGRALLEPVWPLAGGVRWVHSRWAGVEGLLFPALVESPATLTNGRGSFSDSLAEWALAALLFFAKDLRRLRKSQAEGRWDPFDPEWVKGKTLGIVGYGDIGRAVARRARAFEMKVIGLRRRAQGGADGLADEVLPLERRQELMQRSDYVLVATPLTPETKGLVGAAEISAMKPSAVLINVGRGPCVDESALLWALKEGRIRGAALDVFDQEPLPEGHPFYRLDNVLLSPHCADHVPGWLEDAMELFLENLERFRSGAALKNVVDKRAGY
jgi:phosphoglycerate dehydrogenase-like enzyme